MSINSQDLEGKTLYVVSDLHMGDGSDKDNFARYRQRFENFLAEVVEQDPNGCLVLAGDVFEFWQSMHGDVVSTYLPLLKGLVIRGSVFLVGNHDIDLRGFVNLPLQVPFIDMLTTEVIVNRGSREIHIRHGHEFDKFNDPNKSMLLGKIVTLAVGQLELKFGTSIGGRVTEDIFAEAWESNKAFPLRMWDAVSSWRVRTGMKILVRAAQFLRRLYGRTAGERSKVGDQLNDLRRLLDGYHKSYPNYLLVTGHTHKPGWHGDWYVNAGAWQGKEAHYVRITPDGQISLHEWPGQEELQTQLWPPRR